MDDVGDDPRLSQLTAEMGWIRRLAHVLLRGQDADDLAQDAWLVAAEHAPDDGRPLRPWLGRVLVNLARMRTRSRRRREEREARSGELIEPPITPEALVERVELQQLVASEVLALTEPYRSTVLLRYFEGLSCAEIARRLALPEGTVRRRLKVALDELRARIAATNRTSGLAALAPLAGLRRPALGVLAMKKIVAAVIVLILLIVGGVLWSKRDRRASPSDDPSTTSTGVAGAPAAGGAASPAPADGVPGWLAQPGAKPQRIAGRVTFQGAPVPGAIVELANVATESGVAPEPRRIANANGEFDFGAQRAMEWTVRASAPHKASARQDLDLRDPTAASDRLELALGPCDAALVGTVRDASGGPIAKARIALVPITLRPGVPAGAAATSDEAGAYELCFVPRWPLWIVVDVSAAGYGAITYTTIAPGRSRADFALVPEAVIVGRVVRDDTGAPVPEAFVSVPAGPPGIESTPMHGAFTDSAGHFQITGLGAGRHLVSARADALALSAQGVPVVIDVGQTSVEIEIRLERGSTIAGTVMDHDKPVAGVRVRALAGTQVVATAVTQDGGAFVLRGVPRGDIRFSALEYEVTAPASFHVTQAKHDGVRIEVEALGRIIGTVVRNKEPVPGAAIDIHGPNERDLEPVIADGKGHFEVRGLAPGPWSIAASETVSGAFGGPKDPVQLARGQTAEVTLDLSFDASISGRVVDQTGAPVPGVSVVLRNTKSDDTGLTTTLEDGSYRAAMMTGGGDYQPVVKRSIRSTAALPPATGSAFPLVALSDANAHVTGIVLAVRLDHLSIAGKVVDDAGVPVADARVVAELVEGSAPARFQHGAQDPAATTNVDGQFAIDDLLSGSYAVRARSAAGVETTITGISAGRADLTLVVPAAGAIEVTTVGFKSTPQVTAVKNGVWNTPAVATGQGAAFLLKNISPGSYSVTARTASEAASAIVEVTGGKTARITLTSAGSGVIAGHVREFRTGKPVEGMTCRALPRSGTTRTSFPAGDGVRTDAQGAFTITAAPAGTISVACDGLWRNYSDGLRMITLAAGQRTDLDVKVVELLGAPTTVFAGLGADFDPQLLVPRVVRVQPGGPAAAAGLLEGDLVIAVDDAPVTELSTRGVWLAILNRQPGSKVKIGVTRGGKTISADVTLGNVPHE